MRSVMTLGVAPEASVACTLHMTDSQLTLTEFADGDDGHVDADRDDAPTPATNAADIAQLADAVEELTGLIGALSTELEQANNAEYRAEEIDSDPTGMFH